MIVAIVAIVIITVIIIIMYYKSDTNLSSSNNNLSMQLDKKNIMLSNSGIQMAEDYKPSNDNDVVTLKYMDNSILPNATNTTVGMIKLAGDLSGSATAPKIADNVINTNNFSALSQNNRMLGTVDNSNVVGELGIGDQLNISNNKINVNKKLIYAMYSIEPHYVKYSTDDKILFYTNPDSIRKIQDSDNHVEIDYNINNRSFTIRGGIYDCYIKVLYTGFILLDGDTEYYMSMNGFLNNKIVNYTVPAVSASKRWHALSLSVLYIKIDKETDNDFYIKITTGDNDVSARGGEFIIFEEM